jgi:hypothetical protein
MRKSFSDRIREMKELMDSETAAAKLFNEIWTRHGEAEARRIFADICTPASPKILTKIKNDKLLFMYDTMMNDKFEPEPNVQKLARLLASENEKLPEEDRYGPRGAINPQTLDTHIRRLLRKRKARIRAYQAGKARKAFKREASG